MGTQNYSIHYEAVSVGGVGVSVGQVVTDMGTAGYAPASTANLALSVTGGYDGIARTSAVSGSFVMQSDGIVPASVTKLGPAADEQFCNVDASGGLTRSTTQDTGKPSKTIGKVRKDGSVALSLGGAGGSTSTVYTLDAGSAPLAAGDAFVQTDSTSDPPTVARLSTLNVSKGVVGFSTAAAAPGSAFLGATTGQVLPRAASLLGDGAAGYIVVDPTTARPVRKAVPGFGDIIGGITDTKGNVSVSVQRSQLGQYSADDRHYGATGDPGISDDAAIQAMVADAFTNTGTLSAPQYKEAYVSPGYHQIATPIRIHESGQSIGGSHGYQSVLNTAFYGPAIVGGPDLSADPALVPSGPFGGNAFQLFHPKGYNFDLRRDAYCELDGAAAFTVEFWVNPSETVTGSTIKGGMSSCGRLFSSATPDQAFAFQIGGATAFGSVDNNTRFYFTIGGVTGILYSGVSLPQNTWTHLALDYDGTHVRLLQGGVVVASTTASGTWTQKKWESVVLGFHPDNFPRSTVSLYAIAGKMGPVRISNVSRYGASISVSSYTPPSANFVQDSSTIFLCNWDTTVHNDIVGAFGPLGVRAWIPVIGGSVASSPGVTGLHIHDLVINGGFPGGCGGIVMNLCYGPTVERVKGGSVSCTVYAENNCFLGHFEDISHNGSANSQVGVCFSGAANSDTCDKIRSFNSSFPIVVTGSDSIVLRGCEVGTWKVAGLYVQSSIASCKDCLWDAEGVTTGPMAGAIVTGGSFQSAHNLYDIGGLAGIPTIILDEVEASFLGDYIGAGDSAIGPLFSVQRPPPSGRKISVSVIANNELFNVQLSDSPEVIDTVKEAHGVATLSYSANHTLTINEWHNKTIEAGGSPTGTQTYTAPTSKGYVRIWVNETAQSQVVKTAAGTGPTIAAGTTAILRCDGTNIVRVA